MTKTERYQKKEKPENNIINFEVDSSKFKEQLEETGNIEDKDLYYTIRNYVMENKTYTITVDRYLEEIQKLIEKKDNYSWTWGMTFFGGLFGGVLGFLLTYFLMRKSVNFEIKDVLNRNVAPTSIKGIKKRCRAGFGKCQGGFCQSRVLEVLAKHYNVSPLDILFIIYPKNIPSL